MHLPARFPARLAQCLQEPPPVGGIVEEGFATVAPVHHVVDRAGILKSQLAGHGEKAAASPHNLSIPLTDTFSGAHNILDIRCVMENGQFDAVWYQRPLAAQTIAKAA